MEKQLNKKVPAIRFKEFKEGWDEQPIGKVFAEKKRPIALVDEQEYELITVKRRNGGITSRGHLLGREILVKNYYQLKAGDFVVSKRQVVHGATGVVPETLNNAIVSNEYLVAEDGEQLTAEFMNLLSFLPDMKSKFFLSSYGVDIEKLFFDAEDWKQRRVTTPALAEQAKISNYFKFLDQALTLHQHKHNKLFTLKQAMLQKMFPKDGTLTPEVRFKGFEGQWKNEKLGDLGRAYSGIGFPENQQGGKSGVPFFKVSDMNSSGNEYEMSYAKNYVTHEQINESGWRVITDVPGVIFAKVGAAIYLNRKRLVTSHFLIDNNTMAFLFYGCLYVSFGKYLFDRLNLPSYAQVGALPSISSKDIESIVVQVPSLLEQQKIGNYFQQLDQLISQHATQLEKLKQIKAACLERMFV